MLTLARKENKTAEARTSARSKSTGTPARPVNPFWPHLAMHVQRKCACGGEKELPDGTIQAKLTVNRPGDEYEREADNVADHVMRVGRPAQPLSALPQVQRMCPECEEELQRQPEGREAPASQSGEGEGGAFAAPPLVEDAVRSPGEPLDSPTRTFMESRFGYPFGAVRVHTDEHAAKAAQAVNARAFTLGADVVFGKGQYTPRISEGRRLLAHELTHVVQQGAAGNRSRTRGPAVQRDLALPPVGAPAPLRQLTQAEINDAITFNQGRFSDPYSIRVIRDVIGLDPLPAVVDQELVEALVQWQAERHMTQDGKFGHSTTRSFYLELVAESQFRDAVLLLMDSYHLPADQRLNDVSVGAGADCCGAGGGADAVTAGGAHCGGGPIEICFCQALIPRTAADYDHFVRITGHELVHVPQCAAGTGNVDVDEFEAFFWEACAGGRAPRLAAADRVNHANIALGHFPAIPAGLRTAARIAMRDQLNNLIAAGGAGAC